MKEKKKINFLPFNLFYCLATGSTFFILLSMSGLSMLASIILSVCFYLTEVNRNTTEDYLLYKIKQLEDKK